jgi:hypothetical protein
MAELKRLQSQNAELFSLLDNKIVKQNNEKDHARFLNLLNIKTPDPETMTLMAQQAGDWSINPLNFWGRPMLNVSNFGHIPHLSS